MCIQYRLHLGHWNDHLHMIHTIVSCILYYVASVYQNPQTKTTQS